MEPVIDRAYRWASSLPQTDAIPITDSEKFEFAEKIAPLTRFVVGKCSRDQVVQEVLAGLEAGTVRFLGHPVILLKDSRRYL